MVNVCTTSMKRVVFYGIDKVYLFILLPNISFSVYSVKIDLRLINFRQNLRDSRAFSWSTAFTENMKIMSIR